MKLKDLVDETFTLTIPPKKDYVTRDDLAGCIRTVKRIIVSEGIKSINGAFNNMPNLEEVFLPSSLLYIGPHAFEGSCQLKKVSIENGPIKVEEKAFYGCTAIEEIDLPVSIKTIGHAAFGHCVNLKKVTALGLQEIRPEAFYNCLNLSSISLGELEIIGYRAFWGCVNFGGMYFSDKLYHLGDEAFRYCQSLEEFDISKCSKIETLPESILEGCKRLNKVLLPNTITKISNRSFVGDEHLKEVRAAGVNIIEEKAFMGCSLLEKVSFPAVTYIGKDAFDGCYNLTTVELSDDVQIEKNAIWQTVEIKYL